MVMLEWEKHVTKGTGDDWPKKAWCGESLWDWTWAFLDSAHAQEAESKGSQLRACPDCKKAIRRAQRPGPTLAPED